MKAKTKGKKQATQEEGKVATRKIYMYMKARRRPNIDRVSGVSAQHQHSKSKQHMKSRRRPNIDRVSGVSDISKQAHCGNGSGMGELAGAGYCQP